MSAGSFVTSRYESNGGGIFKVRVQPETIDAVIGAVSNGPPAGAITQEVSALARGGKRQIGVVARTATLKFTGAKPAGYTGNNAVVPVLSPDTYDAWTTPAGQTGTYLAAPVEVVGQSPERKR